MLTGVGCASSAMHGDNMQQHLAPLVSTSKSTPGAHYDRLTGKCSAGALQLLSQTELHSLSDGWNPGPDCKLPVKLQIPSMTSYPGASSRPLKSGSAQVVVRLEANGSVESVHAICATDAAFAQAAEQTAKAISYAPATCNGVPARSVFLEPFHYDR